MGAAQAIIALENAVGIYSDRKSKHLLLNAVSAWLESEVFVKQSVVSIARRQKEIGRYVLPSHERYLLLSWTCSLIVRLRQTKQTKAANVMIVTAAQLLTAAVWDAVGGRTKVWAAHKQLLGKVFEAAGENFESLANSLLLETKEAGLVRFLAERKEVRDRECAETRSKLVKIFLETVIVAKTKPNAADVEAASPLIESLSKEELSAEVMPGIQRMMKRSPEVIISTLVTLLPKFTVSLSECASELLAAFIAQLQSSDQSQRDDAGRAALVLCDTMAEEGVLEETTTYLVDLVTSRKVKQWYERQQVVNILASVSKKAVQLRLPTEYFNKSSQSLLEMYGKESNEAVKEAILKAILFNVHYIDAFDSKNVAIFGGLLKGKSDLKPAAVDILVGLSANKKIQASVLLDLQGDLFALLKESITKSASRHLFPSTMLFLMNISRKEALVWETMRKEGIPEKIVTESASLFSGAVVKTPPQQGKDMATICRDLLLGLSDMNISQIIPGLCTQLVVLGLDEDRGVQKHVVEIMKQVNGASVELTHSLVDALHQVLSKNQDLDFDTQEMQKRAAHLMIALAPVGESGCSCDIVVRLLVLSHLSFFMKEKGTSSAWPLLVRHLTATARVNVEKLFASLMPDILKELLQERGLANENDEEVDAGITCIGVLSSLGCRNFMENLLPLISHSHDFESHSILKESDFKVSSPRFALSIDLNQKRQMMNPRFNESESLDEYSSTKSSLL